MLHNILLNKHPNNTGGKEKVYITHNKNYSEMLLHKQNTIKYQPGSSANVIVHSFLSVNCKITVFYDKL